MKAGLTVLAIGAVVLVGAWLLASNLPPASAALVFPIVGPIVIIGGGLSTVWLKNARERREFKE
ncbi:hypothetical protein [Parafrigoribacterium soli]|uniref:hypothetical protein n=1 Tax=Parafrigoribacterium soli TaxID=3144663 RepID=UPI0032EFB29A